MLMGIDATVPLCKTCKLVVELDLRTWLPFISWDIHEAHIMNIPESKLNQCARCRSEIKPIGMNRI
jgi:hypothetical protein